MQCFEHLVWLLASVNERFNMLIYMDRGLLCCALIGLLAGTITKKAHLLDPEACAIDVYVEAEQDCLRAVQSDV